MIHNAKILEILNDAFSALDDHLGDSDLPVETDEEEREYAPVQYAARLISGLIQDLEPESAVEQRDEAERAGAAGDLLYELLNCHCGHASDLHRNLYSKKREKHFVGDCLSEGCGCINYRPAPSAYPAPR